ncbi:hypothetical protein HYALB_00001482 [Hymenoscyphus albidus]|uniref:Probable glucan endo-1,3-beta-glucosidase eglC n=1 Tax=Hymenoscyphus albidus TaxID=595503 RepID=A0A9N9L9Z6_9HELO|nr:hypothetical protein HYALB_00001482 [Hymenoscyphus albidus]
MRSTSTLLALAAAISSVTANQGFNFGAANTDGTFKFEKDFEAEFTAAKNLPGTNGGFNSARLYTMIQGGSSVNEPIQAIPAAIKTKTTLLLGLWASAGQGPFDAEITALKSAIAKWGSEFTDLVVGISVGSEDLYRASPMGIKAGSGYGADSITMAAYIGKLREAVKGTALEKAPVGHVDTWTAWVNETNKATIDACDWIGVDAYPYFQDTMSNDISSGKNLFEDALTATKNAIGGKELWITETGWPVSGKTQNLGVASTENAKLFWDEVGCPRFGKTNIWWYTLYDDDSTTPSPSFGVMGKGMNGPLFDLSCKNISTPTSSSASSSATLKATASATGSGSGSASPTGGASSGGSSGSGSNGTVTVPNKPNSPVSSPGAATSAVIAGSSGSMIQASFVAVFGFAMAAVLVL